MNRREWEKDPERYTPKQPPELSELRHCDVRPCPRCHVVLWLGGIEKLEKREVEVPGDWFETKKIEGLFCPHCDQLIFDHDGWIEHRAEQKAYDKAKRQEDERASGRPQKGEAVDELEPEEIDAGADLAEDDDDQGDDQPSAAEPPRRRRRKKAGLAELLS